MTRESHPDDITWLLDRGDVVGANEQLTHRQAWCSSDPRERVMWARLMLLRGRLDAAANTLEQARQLDPTCVAVYEVYAQLCLVTGRVQEAMSWFDHAYAHAGPNPASSWILVWVDLLIQQGDLTRAIAVADRYCCSAPASDCEGWFWLGYALQLANRLPEARDAYLRCERIMPSYPQLRNNLSALHLQQEDYNAAQFYAEEALAEDPNNASAWSLLGASHLKRAELDAAECALERALALAPHNARSLQAYSYICKERQRWSQAMELIEQANRIKPQDGSIQWSIAMLQLLHGQYEQGWRNHEARWRAGAEQADKYPNLPIPAWQNESLANKTLFVWGEQGYGDVLQFVRFIPELAGRIHEQGGRLVYCVYPPLLSLIERSVGPYVDALLPSTMPMLPECDYQSPLASLPLALNIGVQDLPGAVAYLKADPRKVERWRQHIPANNKLKVGLVWSGSRTHQRNRFRSVSLEILERTLVNVDQVEFFSLQVGASEELAWLQSIGMPIHDHTESFESFDDTAAYIENLDLVVTVCTSIAHLAGGMGVPTWILLDASPHWVWMIDREDSPWYPSARLYRQPTFGQWEPTLQRVARDLTRQAALKQASGMKVSNMDRNE